MSFISEYIERKFEKEQPEARRSAAACSSRFMPSLAMDADDFWKQAEKDGFSWRPEQKGQALRLLDMQRNLAALEKSKLLTEREACTIGMRLRRKIDALNMRPNDSHRCSLCLPNVAMEPPMRKESQ